MVAIQLETHMSTNVEPILSFVRRKLEESRGQWVEVSRISGVPYHTLTKLAQGQVEDPRISTVQRLVDHFNGTGFTGARTEQQAA